MNDDKKVLACVDQSKYAESVADYATWAAKRMQAPMELLHVIYRHPRLEVVGGFKGAVVSLALSSPIGEGAEAVEHLSAADLLAAAKLGYVPEGPR